MTRIAMRFGLSIFVLAMTLSTPMPGAVSSALAQDVSFIATHRDWHAFQYTEDGERVCYVASKPTSEEGDYSVRGDVYVLVTHRPGENSRNVVSFITGYTYQDGSDVEVTISNNSFELFTHEDTAWARDSATDERLVEAMKAGANMVVQGTSSRGTVTTDTYSLLGFTASMSEIDEACG